MSKPTVWDDKLRVFVRSLARGRKRWDFRAYPQWRKAWIEETMPRTVGTRTEAVRYALHRLTLLRKESEQQKETPAVPSRSY